MKLLLLTLSLLISISSAHANVDHYYLDGTYECERTYVVKLSTVELHSGQKVPYMEVTSGTAGAAIYRGFPVSAFTWDSSEFLILPNGVAAYRIQFTPHNEVKGCKKVK